MMVSSTRRRAPRQTRWALLATAGLLLTVVACKSSDDVASSGGATTTPPAKSTEVAKDPRAPGVTADAVKVGIAFPDLSSLKDVVHLDNGDYEEAYQAVVDSINAKGGIAGRKIDPIFAPINPIGANAAAAACTKLTPDEKVFVAVGFFPNDDVLCYLQTNPTPVVGGSMTQERLSKAEAAWYTTEPGDDVEIDTIRSLAEGGKLDGKVAVVGGAADQQSLDETIKPLLAELDVDVVDTALNDAPLTDTNAGSAQSDTIVERFKSKGADQILVIGSTAAFGILTALSRTDYHPAVRFSTMNVPVSYAVAKGNDLTPLAGAATGGLFDGQNDFPSLGGVTKECVAAIEKAGMKMVPVNEVPEGEPRNAAGANFVCIHMYLLKAILEKAGKHLDYGTFKAAGDSLGEVDLPFSPDPWRFGKPPSADGDPKLYVYEWDAATKAFQADE
jgi:Periplasmic binding protein